MVAICGIKKNLPEFFECNLKSNEYSNGNMDISNLDYLMFESLHNFQNTTPDDCSDNCSVNVLPHSNKDYQKPTQIPTTFIPTNFEPSDSNDFFSDHKLSAFETKNSNSTITYSNKSFAPPTPQLKPTNVKNKYCAVTTWLFNNYEPDPKYSLERITVYNEYCKYCISNSIALINSACFGKAVRSVFPDIKTRRIGVRGCSRYHYSGIRPKNSLDFKPLVEQPPLYDQLTPTKPNCTTSKVKKTNNSHIKRSVT